MFLFCSGSHFDAESTAPTPYPKDYEPLPRGPPVDQIVSLPSVIIGLRGRCGENPT